MSKWYFECCKIFGIPIKTEKRQKSSKMTVYKRQFVQDGYPPINITIIKEGGNYIILSQEDKSIMIRGDKIEEFALEINEVKRWSTSK